MANVAKVAFNLHVYGITDVWVTFHVHSTDGRDPFDAGELALIGTAVLDWWDPNPPDDQGGLGIMYDDNVTLFKVTVQRVEPTVSDPVELTELGREGYRPGLDSRPMNPPQIAVCIGLRSSLESRRGRGRMYLPAMQSDGTPEQAAEGALTTDELADWARVVPALFDQVAAVPIDPPGVVVAVHSRVNGEAASVLSYTVADRFCTQRRRAVTPLTRHVYALDGTDIT